MQRPELFLQDGDGPERRERVPVAVDTAVDDVIVFPNVTAVVGLVAVAVVAVWTPEIIIIFLLDMLWLLNYFFSLH